ncbi:class I adenylate-forming enzyme family protein [Actinosynnema mirum]|uniref:AMP-dependent synthetase and ligase n=1 Tax=Actinosynnema mirum (strain ATCC 29888 / DSM 43827 / JCM 3225 / NBRC 14064 / NCIMB 13271 / NRRL B-12336 / IMRU 3971 / 101) TaxID=446462 RepID=C6WJZ3_ACTMD|nr:fatty acid--CoA ligase family protein [Actinosynnema mirum]ACU38206.1 AMP-dependent synthetase and ligase [Actinosynnema mirum DSM 43827]
MGEPFPGAVLDVLGRAGDRVVLEHGERAVGAAELLDLVARVAAGLRRRGIGPGDGVALLLGVTPEAFAAILAAHVVGARVVGVRPGLPEAHVRRLLDLDVAVVVVDSPARQGVQLAELCAAEPEPGPPRLGGRPDDVARLIHTSGSTGAPKAVAQSYRAMAAAWTAVPSRWPPAIAELASRLGRYLVFGTLASQVMFEYAVLSITAGGVVVVAEDPSLPGAITRHRASASVITVPRLAKLVAAHLASPADLSTLRALLVSGSPLSASRHREALEALGPVVFHGYGQTETSTIAMAVPDDPPGSVGRPLVPLEVRDERGRVVPSGAGGELFVRSPAQAGGYWGDASESAEVFVDGWVRTRDLGHLDQDGVLWLTGRSRDVVIVNANLHHVGPIERVIAEHPDVAEAYVVAVPDEETGEAVHAFVVPSGEHEPDPAQLRELVIGRLGPACAPTRVTLIREPPLAPSGKPDKRLLPPP